MILLDLLADGFFNFSKHGVVYGCDAEVSVVQEV
jgi:hypothetical protein